MDNRRGRGAKGPDRTYAGPGMPRVMVKSTTWFGRTAFVLPLIATTVCATRQSSAQEAEATARAMFEEGRQYIRDGNYEAGCPKIEAAAKMHASPGVLLNLGDCDERTNRTASAWSAFAEAEAMAARVDRPDIQAEADRRKQQVEARLSRLLIHVTDDGPDITIEYDGAPLDRAAWQRPLVVDPGEHLVRALTSGQIAWSKTVEVTQPGVVVVDVPMPRPEPRPRAPVLPESHSATAWTTPRLVGAASAGVGAVVLGIGGVLALVARSQETTAEREVGSARIDDSMSAVREGNVATGFVVAGAAVTVVGIVLWLTAPNAPPHRMAQGAPLILGGRF